MTGKKIAVLGGGNGAHTMAAEFTLKGHTVNMYEMPQFKDGMKKVFETETIICDGVVKGTAKLNMVTDDIAKAVYLYRSAGVRARRICEAFEGASSQGSGCSNFPGSILCTQAEEGIRK